MHLPKDCGIFEDADAIDALVQAGAIELIFTVRSRIRIRQMLFSISDSLPVPALSIH